jgi:hypothetical protein
MSERVKVVLKVLAIVAGIAALLVVGVIAVSVPLYRTVSQVSTDMYVGGAAPMSPPEYGLKLESRAYEDAAGAPVEESWDALSSTAEPSDRRVVRTGWVDVRVDNVDDGINEIRALARRFDAEITDLFVYAGDDGDVRPMRPSAGPANATVTLRVPSDRLDAIMAEIPSLGEVLQQNASATDMTEQYVDLAARLKNLKAEEERLRDFFDRAEDVEDLLAVQRELSRVRGEIEVMQAQVDSIDRQAARATLTIALTEPGPIVRPGGTDWGFREALTRGLQGAVALITGLMTIVIAVSPLLLLLAIIWIVWRTVRRRRRSRTVDGSAIEDTDANDISDEEDEVTD